jgi:SAM-dependent methyltransferase
MQFKPRRMARALETHLRLAGRRAARLIGIETHLASESRGYWEERGQRYAEEVAPILDPADAYSKAQRQFLAELAKLRWDSILEVGCGFGWHLKAIADQFPSRRVVGLDFSFIQLLKSHDYLAGSHANVCLGSAFQVPFSPDSFDVVFTSGMLIYVHPKQLQGAIAELRRVAHRSVITLEYAREHMNTPERLAIMNDASWYGHIYGTALQAAGLNAISSYPFESFETDGNRVPLSFFHATKS